MNRQSQALRAQMRLARLERGVRRLAVEIPPQQAAPTCHTTTERLDNPDRRAWLQLHGRLDGVRAALRRDDPAHDRTCPSAGGGADFVAELVATFGEEAPVLLDELRAAQAEGAAERFRRAAHSRKSNCHTFGATRLAEMVARALELGGVPASAAPVRQLAEEFERGLAELKAMVASANP